MKKLCETKFQTLCSPEALTHVSSPLFPAQTALETAVPVSLPAQVTLTLQPPPQPWTGAGTQLSSTVPVRTGWEQTPTAAKPTPGAAQGVGTGLQGSYQFVWCNQQHCHVHTDTNVQISVEFDGWADGRQVIKSICLENHCHFQLKIAPANSYHNFVLFSAKLEHQTRVMVFFPEQILQNIQ